MAFQIFYIFINVSVIVAPLISGTLGQKVGWHYGFGCAGVVMVLGPASICRRKSSAGLASRLAATADRPDHAGAIGIAALSSSG